MCLGSLKFQIIYSFERESFAVKNMNLVSHNFNIDVVHICTNYFCTAFCDKFVINIPVNIQHLTATLKTLLKNKLLFFDLEHGCCLSKQ